MWFYIHIYITSCIITCISISNESSSDREIITTCSSQELYFCVIQIHNISINRRCSYWCSIIKRRIEFVCRNIRINRRPSNIRTYSSRLIICELIR